MMERVIIQQQPVCATLVEIKRGDLMLNEVEFAAMESIIKILKPLVEITNNGRPKMGHHFSCTSFPIQVTSHFI